MLGLDGSAPFAAPTRELVLVAQVGKNVGKNKAKEEQAKDLLLQLGLWGGILLVMLVIAAMVVRRLRDSAKGDRPTSGDLLSNFQEMRREGDIDDAEFRNIKSVLGNQLRSDVKDGKIKPYRRPGGYCQSFGMPRLCR